MAITSEGNLHWISTIEEFERWKEKHRASTGEKVIIMNPDGSPNFYIFNGNEEWESMV